MNKKIEVSSASLQSDDMLASRRSFFKKAAAGAVVAAAALSPVKMRADDPVIMEEQKWATTLGYELNKNPYGLPSPYEHNVVRRTTPLLSSAGDMHAAVSVTPLQDLDGIITPNGLFFTRTHNGVASINPNEHRLMIHGMVKNPIVLTMDELKRYPKESVIHFLECPANGAPEWKAPQYDSLQFIKGMMGCAEWTGVYIKYILKYAELVLTFQVEQLRWHLTLLTSILYKLFRCSELPYRTN
jgi:sulfane dehydrogenase subunit SoxC